MQAVKESKLAELQAQLEEAIQRHGRETKLLKEEHERVQESFVERTGQVGSGRTEAEGGGLAGCGKAA